MKEKFGNPTPKQEGDFARKLKEAENKVLESETDTTNPENKGEVILKD